MRGEVIAGGVDPFNRMKSVLIRVPSWLVPDQARGEWAPTGPVVLRGDTRAGQPFRRECWTAAVTPTAAPRAMRPKAVLAS